MKQLPLAVELRPEADFAEYLPGPNTEAVDAVRRWATGEGEPFLFLSGPPGTGKTHLLQAACRRAHQRSATALYLPLAETGIDPTALEGLERTDSIALDDLQAVAGDPDWECALFGLYNRLRDAQRRLIVSADTWVTDLSVDLPDLRSRLSHGPGYRLRTLEDKDCERLLLHSAQRRGLELGGDAIRYIMRRYPREPGELLALLGELDRAALAHKRGLTLPLIRDLLRAAAP